MLPCTRLSPAVWVYSLVTISLAASSAVVHQNGYNNVLVALSEDLDQPEDGGLALIESLKVGARQFA